MRTSYAIALAAMLATAPGVDCAENFAGAAFLDQHCVRCHGAEKQKAGVMLHEGRDERSLLRQRAKWREVIELVKAGEMPPPDEDRQPSAAERKAFTESLQAIFERADSAPPDPGRPVLRRLNRAEYNRTIRDLLKTDFRLADNFPADDVGYGFDNIADVLSVSPLLLERYVEAAESIATQAVPLEMPKPISRTQQARFCEPASSNMPTQQWRPVVPSQKDAPFSGPLNTPANIEPDGAYHVRARLYAKSPSGSPVRVAILLTGPGIAGASPADEVAQLDGVAVPAAGNLRILRIVEVTASSEKDAQIISASFTAVRGAERISIAALKPAPGTPEPTLYVEWLGYEGPLDARPPAMRAILGDAGGLDSATHVRRAIQSFAPRAWRRPLTPSETQRLMALVESEAAQPMVGLRKAVTAILASPHFIFRAETPAAEPGPAQPVNDWHLATRLSYFLWSSTPDDELLNLAAKGHLGENLDIQVNRMLRDERATALVEQFALQWLQLGRITTHSADAAIFPKWKPALGGAMLEETRRFVAEVFREDRSILDLLTADFTWVNRPLAELYGLRDAGKIKPGEWQRVSLAGTSRSGLLTHASVLTVTSNPGRTSPVKRGKWILEQLLGNPPPVAPPDIPSLDDPARKRLTGSFRQKLEQHRADPQCASCHTKMDAFGFTLENYDGIGRWRDLDETGARIDASASLPGGKLLRGADGMRDFLLARRSEFARCLTEKMLIFALGRGLDPYDEPAIARILKTLDAENYRFSSLIRGIVHSTPFRMRRAASSEPLK